MPEHCIQDKRIENLEKQVTSIFDLLNGEKGLVAVSRLQVEITRQQGDNINKLFMTVDALRVKDIQTDTEKETVRRIAKEKIEAERERKMYKRWMIGSLIATGSLMLGMIGLLIKLGMI